MELPDIVIKMIADIEQLPLDIAEISLKAIMTGDNDSFSPVIIDALKVRIAVLQ